MDNKEDVRIKQCIEPNQEELMTVYHELGHVFYYLSTRTCRSSFRAARTTVSMKRSATP